jgi:hypothetical protein
MTKAIFPMFAFEREHQVELENGFILAGHLIVDIPKDARGESDQRLVANIVHQLKTHAESGQMPKDALVFGWRDGAKPANAVDTTDDAIMEAWAKRSLGIIVRIDPRRNDGFLRIDADALALIEKHDETEH